MYISHSSKIPGQRGDELQWEEEGEDSAIDKPIHEYILSDINSLPNSVVC